MNLMRWRLNGFGMKLSENTLADFISPPQIIYNIMIKIPAIQLLASCLLTLTIATKLLLNPPFPPTAFLNQKYSLNFKVAGLIKPTFSFIGLPQFFTGFANGTISGTPKAVGSYKIIVGYADKKNNSTSEVILSIASNISITSSQNSPLQSLSSNLYIQKSQNTWIFKAGEPIYVELSYINANEPILASYTNLPDGLLGDNATIQGAIDTAGLYTFLLTVGDVQGFRAQTYFVFNVQPKSSLNESDPSRQANLTSIIDVPVKYQQYQIDEMALSIVQKSSQNTLAQAFSNLVDCQNRQIMATNEMYNSANNLVLAQQSQTSVQQSYNNAQSNVNGLQSFINNQASTISACKLKVELITSNLSYSDSAVNQTKMSYAVSSDNYQQILSTLNSSLASLANASKQKSDAATNYNNLLAKAIGARNLFSQTLADFQTAKSISTSAQSDLENANRIVQSAQLNLQLSTTDNDAATTNFGTALSNVKIANDNIISINNYTQQGQMLLKDAKTALGVAQFNLIQAENNLFVAQAAKAASDKALALILAQSNGQFAKDNSTYIFKGCNNYAYPTMCGTVKIQKLLNNGFRTTNGQILVWGQCTKRSGVRAGDKVYYEGSLTEDFISVWVIQNISS